MGSPGVRKIDRDRLIELVRSDPDATLAELRDRLGIECSCWGIGKVLKKLGYSFKKRQFMLRSKIAPTSLSVEPNGESGHSMLMPGD
jgi:transposase